MHRFLLFPLLGLLTACSPALPSQPPTINSQPFDSAPLDSTRGLRQGKPSSLNSQLSTKNQKPITSNLQPATSNIPYSLHPTPYSVSLAVPFSPQAPFANWDQLHEESCEEMSLLLVHHALEGTPLSREQAEEELQALVRWEQINGYPMDVTITQLGQIAEQYFGYRSRVIEETAVEDLKRLLAEGRLVIVPAAGRDLGNPFFSGEGPWYHMLVLKGYNEFFFVTNDVGTKRGEGYVYRFPVFMNAIHDWMGKKEDIRLGPRRVLVIEK